MTSALDQHAATLATLTRNAVITLHNQSKGEFWPYMGHTFTGPGKWTWLAMLGVHSNLRKAGLIEAGEKGLRFTELGISVSTAIDTDFSTAMRMCRQPKD